MLHFCLPTLTSHSCSRSSSRWTPCWLSHRVGTLYCARVPHLASLELWLGSMNLPSVIESSHSMKRIARKEKERENRRWCLTCRSQERQAIFQSVRLITKMCWMTEMLKTKQTTMMKLTLKRQKKDCGLYSQASIKL